MSGFLLPKPEQLIDLVGHIGAIKLTMDGAFDKKISELNCAKVELEERLGMVKNIEEAIKIRSEAEAYADNIRTQCKDQLASAHEKLSAANNREAAITAREAAASRKEAALEERSKSVDSRSRSIITAQDTREAMLTEREAQLKKNEANYAVSVSKLASDIATFNARLESLKA